MMKNLKPMTYLKAATVIMCAIVLISGPANAGAIGNKIDDLTANATSKAKKDRLVLENQRRMQDIADRAQRMDLERQATRVRNVPPPPPAPRVNVSSQNQTRPNVQNVDFNLGGIEVSRQDLNRGLAGSPSPEVKAHIGAALRKQNEAAALAKRRSTDVLLEPTPNMPASSAVNRIKLRDQLAMESQLPDLASGGGIVMGQPAKQADRIARQYGVKNQNVQKVGSLERYETTDGRTLNTHAFRDAQSNQIFEPKVVNDIPKKKPVD